MKSGVLSTYMYRLLVMWTGCSLLYVAHPAVQRASTANHAASWCEEAMVRKFELLIGGHDLWVHIMSVSATHSRHIQLLPFAQRDLVGV